MVVRVSKRSRGSRKVSNHSSQGSVRKPKSMPRGKTTHMSKTDTRTSHRSRSGRLYKRLPPTSDTPKRVAQKRAWASASMSVGELQFMAKSMGIPFGGLSKTQLVRKLNNYY